MMVVEEENQYNLNGTFVFHYEKDGSGAMCAPRSGG